MKGKANKTRPKVINAGMVGLAGYCECGVANRRARRLWAFRLSFSNRQVDPETPASANCVCTDTLLFAASARVRARGKIPGRVAKAALGKDFNDCNSANVEEVHP